MAVAVLDLGPRSRTLFTVDYKHDLVQMDSAFLNP